VTDCETPACGRPNHNGMLCPGCATGLDRDLHAVANVWADLHTTLTRQDRLTEPIRGGTNTPLPWSEPASRALSRILSAVRALDALAGPLVACSVHCHRCTAQIRSQGRNPDPEPLTRWLRTQRGALVLLPGIGSAAGELDSALRRARAVCDLPAPTRRFEVGPCPRPGRLTAFCDGPIWATIPGREDDPALLTCRSCGHSWETPQWYRAGRQIRRRQQVLSQRIRVIPGVA